MLDQHHDEYLEKWMPAFRLRSYSYRNGPVAERPCRDVCCLVVGVILMLGFLTLGVYTIVAGSGMRQSILNNIRIAPKQSNPRTAMIATNFGTYCIAIASMVFLSVLLSVGYAWLFIRFPKCGMYTSIVMVAVLLAATTTFCFIYDGNAMGVIVLVMLVVWLLVVSCCYRRYIQATITIGKVVGLFFSQGFDFIFTTGVILVAALALALLWVSQITSIVFIADQTTSNPSLSQGLYALSVILFVFVLFWMAYAEAFVIASHVASWYYKTHSPWWTPLWTMVSSHIGSLTFASLIILVIKLIRAVSSARKQDDNTCKKVCRCLFHCSLSILQGLTHSMNHYALIMTALEGGTFRQGAKSAAVLYYSYPSSFLVVELIDKYISLVGLFLCAWTPALAGGLLLSLFGFDDMSTFVGVIGIVSSLLSSVVMITVLSEAANSIFILFCLDRKISDGRTSDTSNELADYFKTTFEGHDNIGGLFTEEQLTRTKKKLPTGILSMPRLKEMARKMNIHKSDKKIAIKCQQTSECSISKPRPPA